MLRNSVFSSQPSTLSRVLPQLNRLYRPPQEVWIVSTNLDAHDSKSFTFHVRRTVSQSVYLLWLWLTSKKLTKTQWPKLNMNISLAWLSEYMYESSAITNVLIASLKLWFVSSFTLISNRCWDIRTVHVKFWRLVLGLLIISDRPIEF